MESPISERARVSFYCPICNISFDIRVNRDEHLREKHTEYILSLETNSNMISLQSKNLNSYCDDLEHFVDEMLNRVQSVFDTENTIDIHLFFFSCRLLLEKVTSDMSKIYPKIKRDTTNRDSTYSKLNNLINMGTHYSDFSIIKKGVSLLVNYSRILTYFLVFFNEITSLLTTVALEKKSTETSKKRKEIDLESTISKRDKVLDSDTGEILRIGDSRFNLPGDKFKVVLCNKRYCNRTDCKYAHGESELRKEICYNYMIRRRCVDRSCKYSHGPFPKDFIAKFLSSFE